MSDLEIAFLAAGVALSAIMIALVIVYIIVFRSKKIKYDWQLKDASNSIRLYIIDLKNENVTYFNRSELRKRYTISTTQFFNHFQENERDDLIEWVNQLVDKEASPASFKEIHVISRHRKYNLFSLLQVDKINYKKQMIYMDSYLVKANLTKKSKNNGVYRLSTQEQFNKIVGSPISNRGITFAFNFFDKRNKDEPLQRITFLQFVNIFNSYVTLTRPIIEYGTHQIVVSDLRAYGRPQLLQLTNAIKNDINKYLLIASLQDKIGFTIGVAENKAFRNEPEKLVNTVISLAETAQEDEQDILWYEEGRRVNVSDAETYRTEVERIIRDKKLKYLFRPIVDMNKATTLGYQSFVEPLDSFFGTISELKSYAFRTEDDRMLFATIARNLITRFAAEKDGDSLRLFFPISSNEKGYAYRTLSHIQNINDIHIVLVYNEEELNDVTESNDDDFAQEIKTFKSKGFEVALEIQDNELTLSSNIYGSFDFFLVDVDSNLRVGKQYSQRALFNFRGSVEKLLKYQKPIIALDIPTWDSVELVEKLGIDLVSSDVIAPKDENVLPIPTKSLIKIKDIKE
ncbi:MAG: hypothetical protein MJ221_03055 [Bacilli bacterium]|nr:hypothetical protein [Bacilli bacterium]